MPNISNLTMLFLTNSFIEEITEWLDDPDEFFTSSNQNEFSEWYKNMLAIASDIKMNFWGVVKDYGTEYEIKRVKNMVKKVFGDEPLVFFNPEEHTPVTTDFTINKSVLPITKQTIPMPPTKPPRRNK